ncbi:MAG: uracil-DNA glycosylase [Pseudomonadota bacterium]
MDDLDWHGAKAPLDWHSAKALLDWQVELGADEAIGDAPIDRYGLDAQVAPAPSPASDPAENQRRKPGVARPARTAPKPEMPAEVDAVAAAKAAAEAAQDRDALYAAQEAFDQCELKLGARNFVFSDGQFGAKLMIVGEAPGREEDIEGKPFVGRAGQLLDKMLAAIGQDRSESVYITNVLPWRPPQNRDPKPAEIAMMVPFLQKHIALADPDVVIAMGNISCTALLGRKGITRMRGTWETVQERPLMPMFHPAYLLRNPIAKREAWADLCAVRAKLAELKS